MKDYWIYKNDGGFAQLWSDDTHTLHFGIGFDDERESTASLLADAVQESSLEAISRHGISHNDRDKASKALAWKASQASRINIETEDLFALRRNNSGSGNPRDIESLLTGSEIDRGLGYHDKRVYTGPEHLAGYWTNRALSGHITDDEILAVFPRVHRRNVALPSIAQAVELTRESFADALASHATCG